MGFLDQNLSDLTLADLQKLIAREVSVQVPSVPAGLAELAAELEASSPLLKPPNPSSGDALTYDPLQGGWVNGTPAHAVGGSDGYAPASSPTPTLIGGTNLLVATWSPVTTNSAGGTQLSPVTYEVHVSTASGFTPSSTTLYQEIVGSGVFIKRLPDGTSSGTALTFSVPYYVRLIAKDVDGAAAAGTQSSSADMVQINGNFDVQTGTIKSTLLESQLVLSTTILAGTPSGARIELTSSGIIVYDASNNPQTSLPSDGSTSVFRGNVETGQLIVDDNATINGASNVMAKGSALTLLDRVPDPSGGPTLNWNIQKTARSSEPASNVSAGASFEINSTNGYWTVLTDNTDFKSYLAKYDASGVYQSRLLLGAFNQVYDICLFGGVLYVLYQDGSGNYKLGKVTNPTNTGTWVFASIATITSGITTSTNMGLTNDGTNLVIFSYHGLSASAVLRTATYTTLGVFGATTDLIGGGVLQNAGGTMYVGGATYDGTNWWVTLTDLTNRVNHVEKYVASTHTIIADTNASFVLEGTWYLGIAWNSSTSKFEMGGVTYLYKPTDWTWTHASGDKFFVQYSWYDGTHESKSSPATTANLAKPTGGVYPQQYGRLSVTVPTFPSGVTIVRTFMIQGSGSAPAAGSTTSWLQTTATYADANNSVSYHILKWLGSGTHDIATSTFGGATSTIAATASSIAAPWLLGGDGELRLPRQVTATRYSTPTAGDHAFNTTTSFPEFYDGSNWVIEGEREEMEIAKAIVDLGTSDTYPITSPYDPVNATAQSGGGFATGLILGVAQMTRVSKTATGIALWNGAAGTAGAFNGAALYHLNAAGDWVFDIDSGPSTQASIITGTGQVKVPFTGSFALIPGRVYIAAVIRAFTGSPTFLGAGGAAALLGGTAGAMRCASAAKTGRQNGTIVVAGLTSRTVLPYQVIY